jgi:hypothetical protein
MITTKILEIVKKSERDSKYGKMYAITLKCENWEYITLNKKNPESFKVWNTVNYEVLEPWKKWKEIQQDKPKRNIMQDQRGYFTSIAFQIAFQSYSWEESYKYCSDLARRIFADMMDNYDNKQPEEQSMESKKDQPYPNDLPF